MSKLFLVLGSEGAGKTTVLSGIKSAHVVSVGDEMFKLYKERFGITSRDEIRKKSIENYEYMIEARNEILKKAIRANKTVVIDTHATVKVGDAYEVGLSMQELDTLKGKVAAIIYIDAKISDIIKRREKDKETRKRQMDSEEVLTRHRELNMTFMAIFALRVEAPIYIVNNDEGKLVETQKHVDEIIKSRM